jgi:hypothetical protein
LKYNNKERPSYNKKDKEFILENKTITNRLNKTKLYHDFPSKLKEEFIEKRIYMNKRLDFFKKIKIRKNYIIN